MATLNIRRDVQDTFYRYKMPVLIAKVEGKGNGIKTVISNMSDIAKSLGRPPSYPTKFFGCELGAQVICDEKSNRYIVNGSHEAHKLQDILDGFITKFVLCPSCKNPETELVLAKDSSGIIFTKCKACGERKAIADQQHRLIPFIQKTVVPLKKSKNQDNNEQIDNEPEIVMDNGFREGNDQDDQDWFEDMSSNAVAKRREDQIGKMTKALRDQVVLDDNDNEDSPLNLFGSFLDDNPDDQEIIKKIQELNIKSHKALVVIPQVLFANSKIEDIYSKVDLLQKLCTDEKCQKGLLGGLERLVMLVNKDLQRKFPLVLQSLYQGDVLEEDVLLQWAEHPSKKYLGDRKLAKDIRSLATPFIDWLKQASSCDNSD